MKKISLTVISVVLFAVVIFAQVDTGRMVKYSRDFKFADGIFMTFKEFKNNDPSIRNFEVIKNKNTNSESDIVLKYTYTDSTGKIKNVMGQNCFAYSKNGVLYFNDGDNGFYRMFIVGALSHFMAYQHNSRYFNDYYDNPAGLTLSANDVAEYVLDFETGEKILFTYHNFKDFLKTHDAEMPISKLFT